MLPMGITAENVAEMYGIEREIQDKFALGSQQRARKAIDEGKFKEQIVPVGDFDTDYVVLKFEYIPHKNLCGFRRVHLQKGEKLTVKF